MGMEGNSNVSCWKEDFGPVAADSSTPSRSLYITTATAISSNHITGSSSVNKTTTAAEEVAVELPGKWFEELVELFPFAARFNHLSLAASGCYSLHPSRGPVPIRVERNRWVAA